MLCPICNGKIKVKDVVHNTDENETYRLRECCNCHRQFYTSEFEIDGDELFTKLWEIYHR